MKLLALFLVPGLAIGAPSHGSGGKANTTSATVTTSTMHTTGHGGGTGRLREYDPRQPPPLDPKREVSEQDCTKPVDLTKGNLKCK